MDEHSPVTEVILEMLARLLAEAEPDKFDNMYGARRHIQNRLEHFQEGVKPYSDYVDPESHRAFIVRQLDRIEADVQELRALLESTEADDGDS